MVVVSGTNSGQKLDSTIDHHKVLQPRFVLADDIN